MDKVKNCRTVINKRDIIENQFRNLSFELLAGEENYVTKVRENGLTFELDFAKVFWNSRLSTERSELVNKFSKGDLIYDVFAGVGPFAIAAAVKKHCIVVANDLNPDCVLWLEKNIRLNKVRNVDVHNLDGGQFIEEVVPKDLFKRIKENQITKGITNNVHFIMNLPAIAVDFLKHFVGIFNNKSSEDIKLYPAKIPDCFVHCYTFCKGVDDDTVEVETKVEKAFGGRKVEDLHVEYVRNVAPNKHMMRASFKLTADIMFDGRVSDYDNLPVKE